MFRNAFGNATTLNLVAGISLCTIGGAMLYIYYKKKDDDEDIKEFERRLSKSKNSKVIKIQMIVSTEHVPLILGHNGSNLNSIQDKTNTIIKFRDKDDNHKYCEVIGQANDVRLTRSLINKEINRAPIVKEEMLLPQSVCGRIMGRCGEAMQEICRVTMAKVSLDANATHGNIDRRRIIIMGNRMQVNSAIKLLEEKIDEDAKLQREIDENEQRRGPRRSPTNSLHSSHSSLSFRVPSREKLITANNNKGIEVYVSAIASPLKFWVQMIGKQTKQLDSLVAEMTEYYETAANREKHTISEPYLGQIVTAAFKFDGKWYRAQIVGILPNQYNSNEVVLDLYFVDYGDSEYVSPHEVFDLRTDFLTLRFQAVECFLANVKSTSEKNENFWESQAIEKFEELTQVANWKKLVAKVITYKDRPKSSSCNNDLREGSPIPGVELYDFSDGEELNLGYMLISYGLAAPLDDLQMSTPRSNDSPRSRESLPILNGPTDSSTTIATFHSAEENNALESKPEDALKNGTTEQTLKNFVSELADDALDAHLQTQLQFLECNNKTEKGTNIFLKQNGINAR